jgi:hypothetical protein
MTSLSILKLTMQPIGDWLPNREGLGAMAISGAFGICEGLRL